MNIWEYFREIRKIQFLTPEEEKGLWHSYKSLGDEAAREKLIIHYQPLVVSILLSWRLPEGWLLDTLQEGMIGLLESVEGFEPERGIAFSLYSMHRIRGQMVDFLRKEGRMPLCLMDEPKEEGASWRDQLVDPGQPVAEIAESHWLSAEVNQLMERLPEKEQKVLQGVYLEDLSHQQVANRLEVSLGYVYRLQDQGVRRIRGMLSRWIADWNGKKK